jgi:hypothetical protein
MKKFLTAIALFFVFSANAQVFDGVSVSGDLPTAIAKFKEKGYVFKKYVENGAILNGKVGYRDIELYIFVTPKSKKIFKFNIYFEEQSTWSNLKYDYDKYYEIFKEKYGAPDSEYSFFSSPYEAGDGYEMTAVQLEKATFAAYWLKRSNITVAVTISKWKQVQLTYENDTNTDLKKKELTMIENNSF